MSKIQNPKKFMIGMFLCVCIAVVPMVLILSAMFEYYKINNFGEDTLIALTSFIIFCGALIGYFTPNIKPIKKLLEQTTPSENGFS